jgi:hypothetical protein
MKLNSCLFDRCGIAASPWLVIACLVLSVSSAAFGSEKCGALDRVANAILLAQTLYPELKGGEFSLQFSGGSGPLSGPTDARSLRLTVHKPEWHPPGDASARLDGTPRAQDGAGEIELPQASRKSPRTPPKPPRSQVPQ